MDPSIYTIVVFLHPSPSIFITELFFVMQGFYLISFESLPMQQSRRDQRRVSEKTCNRKNTVLNTLSEKYTRNEKSRNQSPLFGFFRFHAPFLTINR